ncbi:MAG: hypothetical protein Q9186_006392 [Xanthomendoza sp. 1 TL-2023]
MTHPNESHRIRNFAPIQREQPLVKCPFTGKIPVDLTGGEYVRNGGNPVANEALGRDAHWFDGDGMLTGIYFRQSSEKGEVQPEFVNQYILTDVYLSTITSPALSTPLLPSIATLVNPLSSLLMITLRILRTLLLVLLSHLPGSEQAIRKISVANTALLYHDGRALATCESGPPMRLALPGLGTVGWFNGEKCEGEHNAVGGPGFGGEGPLSFFREWTTAHPRVDPNTQELLLFHSTFVPPYVRYSILTPASSKPSTRGSLSPNFQHAAVPGVHSAKMMHDFGVSATHTVILDLPLALDPLNLVKNRPVVAYDPTSRSRFGVFPRYRPESVRWYETRACCIFHTANTWDSMTVDSMSGEAHVESVNMLACRLTSASLVFSAGALAAPVPTRTIPEDEREVEQCRLYYYNFCLDPSDENVIRHQWALSAIPFEFPSMRDSATMSPAKYIYGCSVSDSSFGAALGRAVKMNTLVRMDVETLVARGRRDPPRSISGCVDTRNIDEILNSKEADDPIKIFKMPEGWYAQESRFVPRQDGVSEDDGWLLSYVFDESQLQPDGECKPNAKSELWIIDAKSMSEVVAKVQLPQRVPYGLHGNWFSREEIKLASVVLVTVVTGLCFAAPTSDTDGLSIRENSAEAADPNYPGCGAPICRRNAAASSDLVSDGKNAERTEGTTGNPHKNNDRSAYLEFASGIFERENDKRKICVQNCPRYRRPVKGPDGKCICEPQRGTHERDNTVIEVIHGRSEDDDGQDYSPNEKRQIFPDACKHKMCPPGKRADPLHLCSCRTYRPSFDSTGAGADTFDKRDLDAFKGLEERKAQLERSAQSASNAGPLDCASMTKCPTNQHPVNNAADGMCECVTDDTPTMGILDCASIAKCPADQHPVFNNNAGQCECIPEGTQLDCASISKCSDGAHPMNYNGNCICVPDGTNPRMKRDFLDLGGAYRTL